MAGTPGFKFDFTWAAGGLDMKLPREALVKAFADGKLQRKVAVRIRKGKDSLGNQFIRGTTVGFSGNTRWPKTKAFGDVEAPAKTLQRSGALRSAWLGEGPGSLEVVGDGGLSLTLGVDTGTLAYAAIHQSATPTVIKANPANRSPGGRLKMFWFLWLVKGVRVSETKLLAGFTIPPRRLALNDSIMDRVGREVWSHCLARGLIRLPTEPEG